ncbi:MAG: hypothetical protein ACPGSC_02960 [Granulosicoccaceae bacterium]
MFDKVKPTGVTTRLKPNRQERRFPCQQCGAVLRYAVGQEALSCDYCGHAQSIEKSSQSITEHNLREALQALDHTEPLSSDVPHIGCDSCGAHFSYDAEQRAGECPFCSAPVVLSDGEAARFRPESLLPFEVSEQQARDAYKRWLKGLWFAPSKLKRYAQADQSLNGVYLPYWTYDSDTQSQYQGERGDTYYVSQWVTVVQNGRRVRRQQKVPKVRWRRVGGRVTRHFDDVLVGASDTLPRQITDRLHPWDLHALVPYNDSYLSGMRSEVYQVPLDEGFDRARRIMSQTIKADVQRDIGGDFQRIHDVRTRHSDTTFKHVLLPLWTAAFRFGGKHYRFVVNGRTGKVLGERPYSKFKVALAVVAALIAAAVVMMVLAEGNMQGANYRY